LWACFATGEDEDDNKKPAAKKIAPEPKHAPTPPSKATTDRRAKKLLLLLHQDADAELSGNESSIVKFRTDKAMVGNEGAALRALLTSKLKVEEQLAAAAKNKAEAEKISAEAEKIRAEIEQGKEKIAQAKEIRFMKDFDDLKQGKGEEIIGAIQNVGQQVEQVKQQVGHQGSFLAQKVENVELNITREFKTQYKAKQPFLEVTTSPAPTHRF
jgi:hypothetical protein